MDGLGVVIWLRIGVGVWGDIVSKEGFIADKIRQFTQNTQMVRDDPRFVRRLLPSACSVWIALSCMGSTPVLFSLRRQMTGQR